MTNSSQSLAQDEVTLVTAADQELRAMDKIAAHRHPAPLHRAISVWLVNQKGELLLQQRSPQKITGAGWWGNTVCGNVWPSESYFDCAQRRLKVELGIDAKMVGLDLVEAYYFEYRAYVNSEYGENELDHVFVARFDGEIQTNPKEVSDVLWVDLGHFLSALNQLTYPAAQQTLHTPTQDLIEMTPPVNYQWQSHQLEIAPWTVMMARDPRLKSALQSLPS